MQGQGREEKGGREVSLRRKADIVENIYTELKQKGGTLKIGFNKHEKGDRDSLGSEVKHCLICACGV